MRPIPEDKLKRLQEILERHFNRPVSAQEAARIGVHLIHLYRLVFKGVDKVSKSELN